MVSFKITYFQKSLACIGCFGYLPKLKRSMGLVFTADSLLPFSMKILLIKYPINRASLNIWGEGPSELRHYN